MAGDDDRRSGRFRGIFDLLQIPPPENLPGSRSREWDKPTPMLNRKSNIMSAVWCLGLGDCCLVNIIERKRVLSCNTT